MEKFIEITKDPESFPRGIVFRKRVYDLQSPEELWKFALTHEFLPEELLFFVERLQFTYASKARKEYFTDKMLEQTGLLLRFVTSSARGFDKIAIENKQENPEMGEKVQNMVKTYIKVLNVLVEFRASEEWHPENVFNMLCISMDQNKLQGPIGRRLLRIDYC